MKGMGMMAVVVMVVQLTAPTVLDSAVASVVFMATQDVDG
jgi:hypothetical protein